MDSKEYSKQVVAKLVEKFKTKQIDGKVKNYNEDEIKKEFILPLFCALGWDTDDNDEVGAETRAGSGRADFSFKINGIVKFFLEAKSVKAGIDDPKYSEQVIEYSFHQGVVWAVLTNFEGLRVFNAERKMPVIRPYIDLTWDKFSEGFDKLWLLSKESVVSGELDRQAQEVGQMDKKRPIDKRLLEDFTEIREILSKSIARKNEQLKLSTEEVDEAVQKFLDRLIFIRVCEDRDVEEKRLYQGLVEYQAGTKSRLIKIVRDLFDYYRKYDSGIFERNDELCDQVDVGDDILADVLSYLYFGKDKSYKYNFAYIPADVLGNIYEQYLGHILKKTEKRAKLTEGKTHRKEQGIYYTPTYIVDYIIKNTLGTLAKDKNFDISKIKVLDPACGSGSFLIKAFNFLYELNDKNGEIVKVKVEGDMPKTYAKKIQILKENIFGVDLDVKAVEIAQLNLFLKTMEKGHELPILQKNIKCGNSLIDDPKFSPHPFKWEEEFKEVKEGGFDVVLGNPPYINAIQLTKTVGESVKQYWKNKYQSARGTYDIYILFFEQALRVCKEGGFVAFITPNKYVSSPYGIALREFIANNYKLVKIIDLSRVKVFDDPSVYPIITIIQKTKPVGEYTITSEKILSEDMSNKIISKVSSKSLKRLPESLWGTLLSSNADIIERIFDKSEPLENVAEVQATSTAAEADEYSDYINEKTGIPIINTGTIDRYSTKYGLTRFMNKGEQLKTPYLDTSKISENRKKLYKSPKIIISKLALRIEGFLDEGCYASINTNCIHSPKKDVSLRYLAGIINSRLISFVYSELFSALRMSGGYFQFQAPQLRILPIIKAPDPQDKVSSLVDKMLSLNMRLNEFGEKLTTERKKIEEEIKKTDAEIDKIVYELYELTPEEIKIVEESLKN